MLRALLCVLLTVLPAGASTIEDLAKKFLSPAPESRIMMRWWWFGPAVTHDELARELQAMKDAGIGGVEIQPVYPLTLDDPQNGIRNLRFLSPESLSALRFAAGRARDLGLRVDLTLGSGWPFGGPEITPNLAAQRLRVERLPGLPRLRAGERVLAEFPEQGLRFIEGATGQTVKRAAVGAEGLVLDHYSRPALDKYLASTGGPLLQALGGSPLYAVFCDSLEVYGADWTPDLLDEFRKRRGYDLKPLLPALTGGLDERKGAIRNDWALTLTELTEERFLAPLAEWSRSHDVRFRAQVYGTPPVTLASARLVDLADGEQTQWKQLSSARWASSANHILGRTVTSSETWTWLHSPTFAATPLDVKAEADIHFIQGVNQLIGHGWPYSPPQAGKPGWGFYAAAALNDHNPWWPAMPDLALYLQRVSWMLRQGEPVSDVLLYLPVADIRAHFTAGTSRISVDRLAADVMGREIIPRLLEAGYTFDAVDDGLLEQALNNKRYSAIVLPHVERMPLESLERLRAYVRKGGRVFALGRKPSLAPGYLHAAEAGAAVRLAADALFAASQAALASDVRQLAARMVEQAPPDMRCEPASPAVGYVHRALPGADIYFVANTANTAYAGRLSFKSRAPHVEIWDALTGRRESFAGDIVLPPYGSAFIILSNHPGNTAPKRLRGEELDISTNWEVTFAGSGKRAAMERLQSWTADAETRFYSGVATYQKTIQIGASMERAWLELSPVAAIPAEPARQAGMRAWLAAPVRDAAVVYVNGRRAGAVYAPPYSLDLTGFLIEGENRLRIEVGNTSLNALSLQGEPGYGAVAAKFGDRFQMQDMKHMQPEPSGLIGSVKLVAWREAGAMPSNGGSETATPRRRTTPRAAGSNEVK